MTQALCDNLIKSGSVTYVGSDVSSVTEDSSPINFGEILDRKTAANADQADKTNQSNQSDQTNQYDKTNQTSQTSQTNQTSQTSQTSQKTDISKYPTDDNTENTENTQKTIITKISVQDNDTEDASELTAIAESSLISALISETEDASEVETEAEADATEAETEETNTITQDTDVIEENTNTSEDTTVTNEDSTMYKEQITLENPNLVLMAQTQIITKRQPVQEDEETVDVIGSDNRSIQFKNTGTDSLSNEQAKSALAQSNVKFTEIPVKDNSASKTELAKQVKDIISEEKIKELNIEAIESGSSESGSASEDLMQNQTPQEQAAKAMIRGDVKFDSIKAAQQADMLKSSARTSEVTPSRIVEQVTKQLEGMYGNSKVNIVLNPEHLGRVALNIINTKSGLLAQFTVTTQDVRDILTKGLNGLKEGLLAHGVSVDDVTVKLSETGDREHQSDLNDREGSRGGYKGQGFRRQKDNRKEFEQMMFELNENGNV